MNKACFLDRDGTLNEEVNYLSNPSQLKLIPGTIEALKIIKQLGFLTIVVTNQSGVARGYFTEQDLENIHSELRNMLRIENVDLIDDIFYCPYHIEGTLEKYKCSSDDRKPNTGMITQAAKKHSIELSGSYMIGDSLVDMQLAANSGLKAILVKTGYGSITLQECLQHNISLAYTAENIMDAAKYIHKTENEV